MILISSGLQFCVFIVKVFNQMVVLEEGGMLTTGHNQYLQPDYLSPLPTTVSIHCLSVNL